LVPNSSFFWSDELETLLWSQPSFPPWRANSDCKNALVPIIYRNFSLNQETIFPCSFFSEYTITPTLNKIATFEEAFTKLCGTLLGCEKNFSLLLEHNQNDQTYLYKNSLLKLEKNIDGKSDIYQWLNQSEFLTKIWPKNISDNCMFKDIIKHCLNKKNTLYDFEFEDAFIRSIVDIENRYKKKMIENIALRLQLTTSEARANGSLQEEDIGDNVIRIRITPRPTSSRIHFKFINSRKIKFLMFYGPGEHDDGL